MKIRNGFVSNSSSSSFIIKKDKLSKDQIDAIISNDYKDIIQGYISNMEWDNKKIKSGVLDEFGNILRIYEDNYKNKK